MKKNYKCKIEKNLAIEGGNIPQIQLNLIDSETGKMTIKGAGFLTPFRGYCFQVAYNKDGDGVISSSKVIGLKHITRSQLPTETGRGFQTNENSFEIKKEILRWGAYATISDFCCLMNAIPPSITNNEEFEKFIQSTFDWLNKL